MNGEYYIFHITWVTHSSRVSKRMKKYGADKNLKPLLLSIQQEIEVSKYISEIVRNNKIKIIIFNICSHHVHLLLFCKDNERDNIVRKLKGKSTQMFKEKNCISGEFHLWAQKYNYWTILTDEQIARTYEYIKYNRMKHSLEESKELEDVIETMITPYEKIFELDL